MRKLESIAQVLEVYAEKIRMLSYDIDDHDYDSKYAGYIRDQIVGLIRILDLELKRLKQND